MKKMLSILLCAVLLMPVAAIAASENGSTSGGIGTSATLVPKNNTGPTYPDYAKATTNSDLTTSDDWVYVEIFFNSASGSGSRYSSGSNSSASAASATATAQKGSHADKAVSSHVVNTDSFGGWTTTLVETW